MYTLCLFSFLLVGTLGYPAPQDAPLDSNDVIPQGDAAPVIPEDEAGGAELPADDQPASEEVALESAPEPQAELGPELAAGKEEPAEPAPVPSVSPRRRPAKNDDDDKGDDAFPFGLSGKQGASSYNIFFPVQFSGSRGRSAGAGGSYAAIANSFSTGRKGIATSHATSIGDPSLAAEFFRKRQPAA